MIQRACVSVAEEEIVTMVRPDEFVLSSVFALEQELLF